MIKPVVAVVFAGVLVLATVSSASAAPPPSVQDRIDYALEAVPGGTQVGTNQAIWYGGAMVLTVTTDTTVQAVGSCATGAFCAYSGNSLTGSKLSFTTCSTFSTAALPIVKSIANARSSENVQAKNASGTVLDTLAPGARNNAAPSGITQMKCVP